MDCNSVKEHLVDFLYDGMTAEERAAFSDHVQGCPACKADIASYQKALRSARAALAGPLATEPPARVHDAVMKAATAAAARVAQAARAPRETQESGDSEPGFFARLLRVPWLMPAFGAVSVATVVFLVRVLKNPEVIPGQRPQSIEERAEPGALARPPSEPPVDRLVAGKSSHVERKPAAIPEATEKAVGGDRDFGVAKSPAVEIGKRKASASEGTGRLDLEKGYSPELRRDKKKADSDPLGGLLRNEAGSGAGSARRFAEPPPPHRAQTEIAADKDVRASPMKESWSPSEAAEDESPSPIGARRSRDIDDLLGGVGSSRHEAAPAKPKPAMEPAAKVAKAPARAPAMTPPAPAPSATPAPVVVAPPRAGGLSDDAEVSERPTRSWAQAPAAPPAPRPVATTARASAGKRGMEKSTEDAPSPTYDWQGEDKKTETKKAKEQPGLSLGESVRKADRLFADQNWSAAAEAYRDLLRRFPGHSDAAKWRTRIDQSLVAERERRDTGMKAAKARAAESAPADASKR